MSTSAVTVAQRTLALETRAMLTRLERVPRFAMLEPMLPAAALAPETLVALEDFVQAARADLATRVREYLAWLRQPEALMGTPETLHRRYVLLRLRFNVVLSQFDLFSDAVSQRSENQTGVHIAGLEAAATDALTLHPGLLQPPPILCYLDRGGGGAIRRARTRLPGGGENPVAMIRIPRERMIGAGIASSLVHEAGHQGAAFLDLLNSLRPVLQGLQKSGGEDAIAWQLWERWISEIVADLWAVARVGVTSTLGLMGVVSIPKPFQFRIDTDDPHPAPWIRVQLSCAIGNAFYASGYWEKLARLWRSFYSMDDLAKEHRRLLTTLQRTMPALVSVLQHHRPRSLQGRSIGEVLASPDRHPERLAVRFRWRGGTPSSLSEVPPTLAFAAVGQARAAGVILPEDEGSILSKLLETWALRRLSRSSKGCTQPRWARAVV